MLKQTTIGLIPTDWEVKKLEEISKNRNSSLSINSLLQNTGDYTLYGASGFLKCIDFYEEKERYISIVKDGAGVGRVFLCAKYSSVLGTMAYIKPINNNVSLEYLYFLYQSINLEKYITGSTIPHIYFSSYSTKNVPIPKLPEQQKIATILSTWDAAIVNCKAIIQKLQQRNKGLAQQLLTGDFEQKKLSEIFERVTTKNTEGNQNVITISAQRGFVKQTDFFNKVIASDILDNYFLVKKGDFCYNKSYSNGYDWGAIKRLNDFDKAVVTTLYICFRIRDVNVISGDFFEYYFESGILNKGLSKVANEGGRAHGLLNVTPTDFFSIKIDIPTFEEQKRIAKILSNATTQLNQYQQQLQILQQQKKGLMQQLLTGKVRVKI